MRKKTAYNEASASQGGQELRSSSRSGYRLIVIGYWEANSDAYLTESACSGTSTPLTFDRFPEHTWSPSAGSSELNRRDKER